MAIPAPYYTARDVLGILGVTSATLTHWRSRGVGPAWTKDGGLIRYPVKSFKSYRKRLGADFDSLPANAKRRVLCRLHKGKKPPAPKKTDNAAPCAELTARLVVAERDIGLNEARLDAMEARLLVSERALLRLRASA